jgi:transposase IS4-like protein/DDE family transposase
VPRIGQPKPEDGQRLRDGIALGVLTATFPPELVDRAIEEAGRREQRYRLLPARLVVYYVLAMTLFREAGYEEVMRELTGGLAWMAGEPSGLEVPSSVAISKARARLGPEPLAALFGAGCVPLATPATPGGFYRGLRLVSMDGSNLDTPDTPDNVATFGRPGSGRGESAFPQLRMVALAECGTHAVFAAALGPYSAGEATLAKRLVGSLEADMLVLADRGFTAHPLFSVMAGTGAQLCWRAKANAVLPVLQRHRDGSYRSELVAADDKRTRRQVVAVRVIEYRLDDRGRRGNEDNTYRLVTTILDPAQAPAKELAPLYGERWEFESALDELKTHQRGPGVVLRSKTADGIYQEAWGMLCVHYAIRALISRAATEGDIDPDRLSFTRALRAARRSVRRSGAESSGLAHATAEIVHQLVPRRRLRSNPRVVRRKMSNFNVKRAEHRHWPQPTATPAQAVRIVRRRAVAGI